MEYKNELLDALIGKPVVVGLVKAPDLDQEAVESMREDPAFGTKEPVQSVRASFELVGYDGIGVTLRMLVEGERPFLVPWSAVLKSATKYDARPFVSASCQNSSQPWTCWWYSSALCYCQPDLDEEQRHDNL